MSRPIQHLDLLACPHCASGFVEEGGSIRCEGGHSFDIAREGYVNLTTPASARLRPDTKEMVAARVAFLGTGRYRPLADAVRAEVAKRLDGGALVDLGCGPGHYLATAIEGAAGTPAVGIDLSKEAIKRAARTHPAPLFVVADVTRSLPLRTACASVAMSIFAPRSIDEIARILPVDGSLVLAAAGPHHLQELVAELGLLQVPPDKQARIEEQVVPHFSDVRVERITHELDLSADEVRDVVSMGPSNWHVDPTRLEEVAAARVSVDFLLVTGRRRRDS